MAVRTQPALPHGLSARVIEAMALSPLSFYKRYIPSCETPTPSSSSPPIVSPAPPPQKRYQGTSELIADTDTDSEETKGEGIDFESEETMSEDHQQAVPVEDATADEPLGLGYMAAGPRPLELAEGPVPSVLRLPVRPTWVDPEDSTIYLDIEFYPPSWAPVQTPSSPEWSFSSLPVSPASLIVPSSVATPTSADACRQTCRLLI
nr:hypothetical protein [Tanacetum cinerariifolium]